MKTKSKNSLSSESGASFLELMTTLPIFFVLIVTLVDCALIGYKSLTVQFIASRVVRYGSVLDVPYAAPTLIDQRGTMMKGYMDSLVRGLGLNPTSEQICAGSPVTINPNCGSTKNGGQPGEYVYTRVNVSHSALLGLFTLNLRGEAVARNERIYN